MDRGYQAVAKLYHSWLTGIILTVVTRRGADAAEELVFRMFRRQHLATFLPGLKKLGIDQLPHAVAAAQYHYLSNYIGGVRVEYMYESDRKAWVRYPPPRWMWWGTAICGIPSQVSSAMLRGWHAHNGVTLGNPRLGFVCTKQTVDGQDGLEGYYYEYDRDLAPEERLRFARDEDMPLFDAAKAPKLATDTWPRARRDKAERNYAMEYIRTALPVLIELFGPDGARELGGSAARLIGMQLFDECQAILGTARFQEFFIRMAEAQDEQISASGEVIRQTGWRLMRGGDPVMFEMWNELWIGCLAAHDRRLQWKGRVGEGMFEWTLSEKPLSRK